MRLDEFDAFEPQSVSDERYARLGDVLRFLKDTNCSLTAALACLSIENRKTCKPPLPQRELEDYLVRLWFAMNEVQP